MANGWIRCTSYPSPLSVVDTTNDRIHSAAVLNEYRRRINNTEPSTWLAQANDMFNRFQITRGFEDFGIFPVPFGRNCGDDFPQYQYILSTTISTFWDPQMIYFSATSFCAP
jgi:hypothetical protein